ncbi:MAG: DUF4129 domain-containing protein [Actinomycetota bacterium]
MRLPVVGIVLATAATTLLFAAVATSGGVGLWIEPRFELEPADPTSGDEGSGREPVPLPEIEDTEVARRELPGWLEAVMQVLAVTICLGAVLALVDLGWRHRPRLRWRRRHRGVIEGDPLPDLGAAVVDDAVAQRAALAAGSPRNGIVRCWLRLEEEVAAAGLPRDPAETSAEFTERVLTSSSVDPGAISDLAALYREARFSEHALGEPARLAALDALDRLHETLSARPVRRGGADAAEEAP